MKSELPLNSTSTDVVPLALCAALVATALFFAPEFGIDRLSFTLGTGLVAVASGIATLRMVRRQSELGAILARAALGDLSVRLAPTDRQVSGATSASANRLLEELDRGISDVQRTSNQIGSSSSQITQASQNLAKASAQQSESLQEIASSVEEISSMAKANADNATLASELSRASNESAHKGAADMRKLVDAMAQITESSERVTSVIKVIDDIAFQTNLLALNAAVEAGRAGEAGKGFAVVAEEVRTLAQRSARAAQDTNELIEASIGRTENGSAVADHAAKTLTDIVDETKHVHNLLARISSACVEQDQGLDLISRGMSRLDNATQSNLSGAKALSQSATETSSQVTSLDEISSRFQLTARS